MSMSSARKCFLVVVALALVALVLVPAATATKPTREFIPPDTGDFVITDRCQFPVLVHNEGLGTIVTTYADREGNVVKQIVVVPGSKQTFTNVDTGESLTVATSGPFHSYLDPDGAAVLDFTGPSVFLRHPLTLERGIFLIRGDLHVSLDADGNVISTDLRGEVVDLCAALA